VTDDPPSAPADTTSVGLVVPRDAVFDEPFALDLGGELPSLTLRYETYGVLDADRSNAILVPHALSGDHHVAGRHAASDPKPGWWDAFVGPGKMVDTDRHFVIGVNTLGGCRGSTGPLSTDPRTGAPYGGAFPEITFGDIVRAQRLLVGRLGIRRLRAVVGGSKGGMQALLWAADHADAVERIVPMACALSQPPHALALNAAARFAIGADPRWRDGFYAPGEGPGAGLAVARMIGHVSYLSPAAIARKFGRQTVPGSGPSDPVHWQVEGYLRHQGDAFVRRFDANSLVRITRAVDRFDLSARAAAGDLARPTSPAVLAVGFSSDGLYPPAACRAIAEAAGARGAFLEVESDAGHDAFLLPDAGLARRVRDFLA
jgi:homoserine O-acetyltransferase/O-succinyltransferase